MRYWKVRWVTLSTDRDLVVLSAVQWRFGFVVQDSTDIWFVDSLMGFNDNDNGKVNDNGNDSGNGGEAISDSTGLQIIIGNDKFNGNDNGNNGEYFDILSASKW